jgi:pimeloyl-ACP methyl ester carboxylesterase
MTARDHILLDQGDGDPLLLLPGLGLDERLFLPIVPGLAGCARVVVVRIAAARTLADAARRVLAVLDALGLRAAHIGGLSMGGYAALELMRLAPGRVRSLALMNTQATADGPLARRRREAVIRFCEQGLFDRVVGPFLNRILAPQHAHVPALRDVVLAMTNDAGPAVMAADTRAILERGDYLDVLPAITCPTLVIGGHQDVLTPPRQAELIAARIPGAELHLLGDCGHLSPLEAPRATGHILAHFLSGARR